MKYIIKILVATIFITLTSSYTYYASDLDVLDYILKDGGVCEEYRKNIIEYIEEMEISKEELNYIIDLTKSTVLLINGRQKITEFNPVELCTIYNNINAISVGLNIKISLNFFCGKLNIINNKDGNVLFCGDIKNLSNYYIMYERLVSDEAFLRRVILGG